MPQQITYSRILFDKILAISTRRLWKHSSQNFNEKNSFSWPDLNPSPFLKNSVTLIVLFKTRFKVHILYYVQVTLRHVQWAPLSSKKLHRIRLLEWSSGKNTEVAVFNQVKIGLVYNVISLVNEWIDFLEEMVGID